MYEGVQGQDVEDGAENAQTGYCTAISQILSGKCMNMITNLTGTGGGDHGQQVQVGHGGHVVHDGASGEGADGPVTQLQGREAGPAAARCG